MEGRSSSLDLVRFLALTLVVAGHVWTDKPLSGYVAVFFVVTGYLWKPGRGVVDEARHKWRTLIRPYIAWGVPLLCVLVATLLLSSAPLAIVVKTAAVTLWGGAKATEPFTAYWFLTAMFFACILLRLIDRMRGWFPLVLALVLSVAGSIVFGEYTDLLPLGFGDALWALQFLITGRLLQAVAPVTMTARTRGLAVLPAALALGGGLLLLLTGWAEPMVLKAGYHGTPVLSFLAVVAVSCGALVLTQAVEPLMPASVLRAASVLVFTSTPVLLIHGAVIWALKHQMSGWALFAAAYAIPICIGLVLLGVSGRVRAWLMPGTQGWRRSTGRTGTAASGSPT
jgi:acyltransferase